MSHWAWWWGALALSAVPLVHRILLDRAFAVSGRFTALVDRVRLGPEDAPSADMTAMLAALREQTAEAFGDDAVDAAVDADPADDAAVHALTRRPAPQGLRTHVLFFVGLAMGGALSAWLAGTFVVRAGISGATFAAFVERLQVPVPIVLLLGGVLVGVGTRMAGGCTSGHGLCGVSQLQPGSLVATAAFFGAGVALSFAFGALL